MVASVTVEVVEALVTGDIIRVLTVSTVVVASATVVTVFIRSVVVVGAAVVVVESGNMPAPDPSSREFYNYNFNFWH